METTLTKPNLSTLLVPIADAVKQVSKLLDRKPTVKTANEIADLINRARLNTAMECVFTEEELKMIAVIDAKMKLVKNNKNACDALEATVKEFMEKAGLDAVKARNATSDNPVQNIELDGWAYKYAQEPESFSLIEGVLEKYKRTLSEQEPKMTENHRLIEWARANCPESVTVTTSVSLATIAKTKGETIKQLTEEARVEVGIVYKKADPEGRQYVSYTGPSLPS